MRKVIIFSMFLILINLASAQIDIPNIYPPRCNNNGRCDYFEFQDTCPDDCSDVREESDEGGSQFFDREEESRITRQIISKEGNFGIAISIVFVFILVVVLIFIIRWTAVHKGHEKIAETKPVQRTVIKPREENVQEINQNHLPRRPQRRWGGQ